MFQNNPLLTQLKQQLHAQTPRVEGTVKGTDKGFGFLDVDGQKSYFIPPKQMKKVLPGDRIIATIHVEKDKEIVEPESLVEQAVTRFIGRVSKRDNKLYVQPEGIHELVLCHPDRNLSHQFQEGDWVVAQMIQHPLNGNPIFIARLTEFVTDSQDNFALWWTTLARHQLERYAPSLEQAGISELTLLDNDIPRTDLSDLMFFTIDNPSTEDMDDAICLEKLDDGTLKIYIAIADPGAYIAPNSPLDNIAKQRGLTNYLPGIDIPMLPRELSSNLCSLRPNEKRPALVCSALIAEDGSLLLDNIEFSCNWITSKSKMNYDQVSDWLEADDNLQQAPEDIKPQLVLFNEFMLKRSQWRQNNALVHHERLNYQFIVDEQANLIDIKIESRRIASRMIEEAMITANICAAHVLSNKIGAGIFNVHAGFDANKLEQVITILKQYQIEANKDELMTLSGFCSLYRLLDTQPTSYLSMRLRRYQSYAEMTLNEAPHFGLGFEKYATWTSPIRRYCDLINHRLIKAYILNQAITKPEENIIAWLSERRRLNRLSDRDITDYLYARYLADKVHLNEPYQAEITDITKNGLRAKLLSNGAIVFVPATSIHNIKNEIVCHHDQGTIVIKGELAYQQGDTINILLKDVRLDTCSIIGNII